MKVRNLKANHNYQDTNFAQYMAVLASVKVRNLKANHNERGYIRNNVHAVLASVKVRNLEANHNRDLFTTAYLVVMVIGCWSAYG